MTLISTTELVARNLRRIRSLAGCECHGPMTQERFAATVSSLGFNWKRLTVTEIESARRAMSLAEMIAIADHYGLCVADFLVGDPDDVIRLNPSRSIPGNAVM